MTPANDSIGIESGARRMKVLVTGAAGNLGQKLAAHLESGGNYDLTLLDRRVGNEQSTVTADLSTYDSSWTQLFLGQETVVHLAAEPRQAAPWASLQTNNVDAVINVFRAAVEKGVKRVVFASSSVTYLGHADRRRPVPHDAMPKPISFYGATKIFGERLGRSYTDQYGLSVICMRIGTVWPGENLPHGKGFASQQRWLSNRDFCQAAEKAIRVPGVRFAALFVTSDNTGKPWDLSETRRVLGYEPRDRLVPVRPALPARLLRALARYARHRPRGPGHRAR